MIRVLQQLHVRVVTFAVVWIIHRIRETVVVRPVAIAPELVSCVRWGLCWRWFLFGLRIHFLLCGDVCSRMGYLVDVVNVVMIVFRVFRRSWGAGRFRFLLDNFVEVMVFLWFNWLFLLADGRWIVDG